MTSADKGRPGSTLKSHSYEWLFYAGLLLCLAGCERTESPLQLSGDTMGTRWHVSLIAGHDSAGLDTLQSGIQARLDAIEQSMSTYRSDSEISRFNALSTGTWLAVSADFYTVLSTALMIGRQSNGAYDVTVGPLVDLWGFGPGPMISSPPARDEIERLLSRVGQDKLRLDGEGGRVQKLAPVSLDFSSIAKGYAVDRVANWLQEQGYQRFLVEVGGEMRMSGLSHRGDEWRIAIEEPDSTGRAVATRISVTDRAVATSGDYRNYFELDEKRYSHSIDPRTGYPVAHDLVSVTVIHPGAIMADAWATALIVLGAEQAMTVAQAQGLAVYFIRRLEGGYQSSHTPAFAPFLAVAGQQGQGDPGE